MDDKEEVFIALYERYYERLVAFVQHLGWVESPRDLAQDVFVRVYESMEDYRGDAEWTYIEKIARRLAANALRDSLTKKRDRNKTLPMEEAGPIIEDRKSQETEVIEHEQSALLKTEIDRLPAGQRDAIMLQLGGSSYEEIARALGISVEAVKSRLHEARKAVTNKLRNP